MFTQNSHSGTRDGYTESKQSPKLSHRLSSRQVGIIGDEVEGGGFFLVKLLGFVELLVVFHILDGSSGGIGDSRHGEKECVFGLWGFSEHLCLYI